MARHDVLRPQAWDWPGPRVLLEQPSREEMTARVEALRCAGYAVDELVATTSDRGLLAALRDRYAIPVSAA